MQVGADHRTDPSEDLWGGGQAEAENPKLEGLALPDEPQVPRRVGMDWYLEVGILQIDKEP